MPRRRPSKVLKDQLSKPVAEIGWFSRAFLWAFRIDASGVLTMGFLFVLSYGIRYFFTDEDSDIRSTVILFLAFLILGVFLGIIVVTEEEKSYRNSGWKIRIISGVVAFASVGVMISAPLEQVAIAAFIGAVLGYFGIYWAKWL